MSPDTWAIISVSIGLAILTGIGTLVIYVIKVATRMARTEERVFELAKNWREIMVTVREDRSATDKRLRWLEEKTWLGGRGNV